MSRRRLPALVALVACFGATANVIAYAATLSTTQAQLTAATVPATVPVSTCSLTSSADTYANNALLTNGTNYGTATTLHVRSDLLGDKRTFLTFNIASCSIPAVARVLTSSLRMYLSAAPGSSRTYDLHRVTASWTETGLTWSNQPATAGSATAGFATGTTNGVTLSSDVLADVSSFVAGSSTNYGWRLKDRTEGALVGTEGQFHSREGASDPALVITYYP